MSNNILNFIPTPYFFIPTNSINHNECKKITSVALLVIGGILVAIGLGLIISGACSNALGILIAGPFVLLFGIGITLYACKLFYHLPTLKKPSSQVQQPSVPESPAVSDLQSTLSPEPLPQAATVVLDIHKPEGPLYPQILPFSVLEIPSFSFQIDPPASSSPPSLPLSLFNQVFCNQEILQNIANHMSEKNRDSDGALVDLVHTIEAINPQNTSLQILNNVTQIQSLAREVGFNATTNFKENSLLRQSAIDYIEQMALTLKQVFIDLRQTESFKDILSDIPPCSLDQTHFILLLKSLLNWLAILNLIEFTSEVINTTNKKITNKFCLFMYNLLKVEKRFKRDSFYSYGFNIKINCRYLVAADPTNIIVLKQLIKDALRSEAQFPVILFLVSLLNDLIYATPNPQKNFTSKEKLEMLLIAKESNSLEQEQIIKALKSLKVPT